MRGNQNDPEEMQKRLEESFSSFILMPEKELSSFNVWNTIYLACRYNRGDWSECENNSMTRKDTIRPGCDTSCKPTREITKNCNKDKKNKNKKEKSKL